MIKEVYRLTVEDNVDCDLWFDLYRSITSRKEMAERIIERQIRKKQRDLQKKLLIKKRRLSALKQAFLESEK